MHKNIWRFTSLLTLLALLASPIYLGSTTATSATDQQTPPSQPGMRLINAAYVGKSQPLHSIAPIQPDPEAPSALRMLPDRLVNPKIMRDPGGISDASIVQDSFIGLAMPAPTAIPARTYGQTFPTMSRTAVRPCAIRSPQVRVDSSAVPPTPAGTL